jgi:hypothetical protein
MAMLAGQALLLQFHYIERSSFVGNQGQREKAVLA